MEAIAISAFQCVILRSNNMMLRKGGRTSVPTGKRCRRLNCGLSNPHLLDPPYAYFQPLRRLVPQMDGCYGLEERGSREMVQSST